MAILIVQTGVTYASINAAIAALPALFTEDLTIELSDASYSWAAGDANITGLDFAGFTLSIVGTLVSRGVVISVDGQVSMQDATNIQNIVFENVRFNGNFEGELFFIRYCNDFIFRDCHISLQTHAQSIRGDAFQVGQSLIFEDCTFDTTYASSQNIAQSYIYASGTTGLILRRSVIVLLDNVSAASEFVSTYNNTDTATAIVFEDNVVSSGWARLISIQGNHSIVRLDRNKIVDNETATQNIQLISSSSATVARFPQNIVLRNNWIRVTRGTMFYLSDAGDIDLFHNTLISKYPNWSAVGNNIVNMSGDLSLFGNVFHFNQGNHPGGFTLLALTATGTFATSRIKSDYNYIYSSASGGNVITVNDQALINESGTGATSFPFTGVGFLNWQTASGTNTSSTFLNAGSPSHTFTDFANDDYSILDGDILDDVIDVSAVTNYSGGLDIQNFAREASSTIALGAFDPDAAAAAANGKLFLTAAAGGYELTDFVVNVKDVTDAFVENASVSFDGTTLVTDVNGDVIFTTPAVTSLTTFSITATHADYDDADPGSYDVYASQLSIVVDTAFSEGVDFDVRVQDSNSEFVQGASITFNAQTLTSSATGTVTFTAPAVSTPTTYDITATATDLDDASAVTVTVNPILLLVLLLPDSTIKEGDVFTVNVEDENGDPVNTASVTFNGQTLTPQSGNIATFTAPTIATSSEVYSITATNAGYINAVPVDVTVSDITLELSAPSTVIKSDPFTVTLIDGNTLEPLEGKNVTFNGTTLATDVLGEIEFVAPDVAQDTTFSISANITGLGTVAQDIIVDADFLALTIQTPGAAVPENVPFTITIVDELAAPVEGVSVFFHSGSLVSDVNGEVSFTPDEVSGDEQRTITASKVGYDTAPDVTITVQNIVLPDLEIVTLSLINENQVFMVLVNELGVGPLSGVTVTFDSQTYTTDVSGQVNLTAPDLAVSANYDITASKTGYNDAPNSIIFVQNVEVPALSIVADVSVDERENFVITITDGGLPVEAATVTFNSQSEVSDVNGQVNLVSPAVETTQSFAITATKAGYTNAAGSIDVSDVALTISVTALAQANEGEMVSVLVTNNFGDLVSGASVFFNSQTFTTGALGTVSIQAPSVISDSNYTIGTYVAGSPNASTTILIKNVPDILVSIVVTPSVKETESFTVRVETTTGQTPIEGFMVTFNSQSLTTDVNGEVLFTSPSVSISSSLHIAVSKAGYVSNNTTIVVEDVPDEALPLMVVIAPASVQEGQTVEITVNNADGQPLDFAGVSFANTAYFTNNLGKALFQAPYVLTDEPSPVIVTKPGFVMSETTILVTNVPLAALGQLSVSGPDSGNANETLIFTINDNSSQPVFGSVALFNSIEKATNAQGQVSFTLPDVKGNVEMVLSITDTRYNSVSLSISVIAPVVPEIPTSPGKRAFPVDPLPPIKGFNPAEMYQITMTTNGLIPMPSLVQYEQLAENKLNHVKYKLNSYLIKDQLVDHQEDLELLAYHTALYYLSEDNQKQTITEHLRIK
jgi:hypothetical protein